MGCNGGDFCGGTLALLSCGSDDALVGLVPVKMLVVHRAQWVRWGQKQMRGSQHFTGT